MIIAVAILLVSLNNKSNKGGPGYGPQAAAMQTVPLAA